MILLFYSLVVSSLIFVLYYFTLKDINIQYNFQKKPTPLLVVEASSSIPVTKQKNLVWKHNSQAVSWESSTSPKGYNSSRDISVKVQASNWPTDSNKFQVLCESYGYFLNRNNHLVRWNNSSKEHWDFLEKIVNHFGTKEFEWAQRQDSMEFFKKLYNNENVDLGLLEYTLSLRAYSPTCELHRNLARSKAIEEGLYSTNDLPILIAVIYPEEVTIVVYNQNDYLDKLSFVKEKFNSVNEGNVTLDVDSLLLPGETTYSYDGADDSSVDKLVIFYANFGSTSFVTFFELLQTEKVPFVVRHLGDIHYEEALVKNKQTLLHGYGVRLDIRNIEYRAFDDSSSPSQQKSPEKQETSSEEDNIPKNSFLAGVNVSLLEQRHGTAFSKQVLVELYKKHSQFQQDQQTLPHAYQRRRLSIQASHVICSQTDALKTLQEISQNLPSYANLLSRIDIKSNDYNQEVNEFASQIKELPFVKQSLTPFVFYVNGRRIFIERPSFNVFELLQVIEEESVLVDHLYTHFGPVYFNELLQFLELGPDANYDKYNKNSSNEDMSDDDKDDGEVDDYDTDTDEMEPSTDGQSKLRIDVGRTSPYTKPILYLNNIERDEQYYQYPPQLQNLLFGSYYVRRNLIHLMIVLDPFQVSSKDLIVLNIAQEFVFEKGLPIRFGVIFVNLDEEEEEENGKVKMYEILYLYQLLLKEYDSTMVMSCLIQFFTILETKDERMSKEEVWELHNSFSHLRSSIRKKLFAKDLQDVKSHYFDNVVEFVKAKNIQPHASFMNGLPFNTARNSKQELTQKFHYIVQNDISLIVNSMMQGLISDHSPRSLYSFLLKGNNVYKKYHSLLTETSQEDKIYLDTPLNMTIITNDNKESNFLEYYIITARLDLNSLQGWKLAKEFVELMQDTSLKDAWIGYTILPIQTNSSKQTMSQLYYCSQQKIFSQKDLLKFIQIAMNFFDSGKSLNEFVEGEKDNYAFLKTTSEVCENLQDFDYTFIGNNLLSVNGRTTVISTVSKTDLELLHELESSRTRFISSLLKPHFPTNVELALQVDKFATFFSKFDGSKFEPKRKQVKRTNISLLLDNLFKEKKNPLEFQWNRKDSQRKVSVTVVLDPLTEATQRVTPLLVAIRDHLKLPLRLILSPRLELNSEDSLPISSYYRFVANPFLSQPEANFRNLPWNHVLTLRMDVPEPWNVQQSYAIQDTDNLRCSDLLGCGDYAFQITRLAESNKDGSKTIIVDQEEILHDVSKVSYELNSLLFFGQCYDRKGGDPPNGLQLTLRPLGDVEKGSEADEVEIFQNSFMQTTLKKDAPKDYSDTLVMKNLGYWQLRANPGVWLLQIAKNSKGADMFDILDGDKNLRTKEKKLVMKDFVSRGELLLVQRKPEYKFLKSNELLGDDSTSKEDDDDDEVINVFSLATGHLYERLLKIMMLSVTKRTSSKVKFWFLENFLSPNFKSSSQFMASRIGCSIEFVTYKWPEWLRNQSEKQRIIWGYKILFLDVLFPLGVNKIIYVDADQVVRGDLKELWNYDLKGKPYGYVPFCTSRESTLGYQFWRSGFWKSHLRGKPYHISALYLVDLRLFRRKLVGDKLRQTYQQLSADPNSLSNLDQDLPNFAQHEVPIHSLPQEWLWCETWCSDETKEESKTIDLCNNPDHKESKVAMAKRIISGELFPESWTELDEEVETFNREFRALIEKEN